MTERAALHKRVYDMPEHLRLDMQLAGEHMLLSTTRVTKNEVAQQVYRGTSYDCTLPQQWVDAVVARGHDYNDVARSFVWLYPEDNALLGQPGPINARGVHILAQLALNVGVAR